MAELVAAAAHLAADVAAHHAVILAARERHEAVRALAILSAKAEEATGKTRAQLKLEEKIAGLKEKYKGAADAVGPGGFTPLLLACVQGKADAVTALLALGADPAIEGDVSMSISFPDMTYKCTALMLAARDGHVGIVRVLLAHELVDANQASSDGGKTALWLACLNGNDAVVTLLLAHDGIDVNQATSDAGATPLYIACQEGHAETIKLMLAHDGIDANQAKTDAGATPLYIACQEGHAAVVTLMLAHDGIDVNQARTDMGTTPLYIACEEGHTAITKLMLAHAGIDANQARKDTGATPLYIACEKGHVEIIKPLLAQAGIDANQARTTDGATPLYIACQKRHAAVVTLLLAHDGIDANQARTDAGVTPLFIACQKGHAETIKLMLAHDGIDANQATTNTSETPLHGVIFSGVLLAMQYLVVYGASLVAEDFEGLTPAQLATLLTKHELAEWLNAVSGWSQLQVAAGCRLHKEAAFLLRRGKIDPDDPATTSVKDIMAVVATTNAKPAALPWQNAPPICRATIKLVADATRGWHRTTHWLHHKAVRNAVFAVLVVAGRLQEKGARPAEAPSAIGVVTSTAEASTPIPLLPIELWLFAMRFFKRSWWGVEGATA